MSDQSEQSTPDENTTARLEAKWHRDYFERLLSDHLPRLTDEEFAVFMELVETHRIRRLSMKISVPWSHKQEEA